MPGAHLAMAAEYEAAGATLVDARARSTADLVLGCDMVVVNDYWVLSKVRTGRTNVVLNSYEAMPGTFTTRPDMEFPATDIISAIRKSSTRSAASTASTWSSSPTCAVG